MAASADAQTGDFSIVITGTNGKFKSDTEDVGSVAIWAALHLQQITGATVHQVRVSSRGTEHNWAPLQNSSGRDTYDTTYGGLLP